MVTEYHIFHNIGRTEYRPFRRRKIKTARTCTTHKLRPFAQLLLNSHSVYSWVLSNVLLMQAVLERSRDCRAVSIKHVSSHERWSVQPDNGRLWVPTSHPLVLIGHMDLERLVEHVAQLYRRLYAFQNNDLVAECLLRHCWKFPGTGLNPNVLECHLR